MIPLDEGSVSVSQRWLKDRVAQYENQDDVFRKEFLRGVIFTAVDEVRIEPKAKEFLTSLGNVWHENVTGMAVPPCSGIYLAIERHLFEVWKLYDDFNGAFQTALVPTRDG